MCYDDSGKFKIGHKHTVNQETFTLKMSSKVWLGKCCRTKFTQVQKFNSEKNEKGQVADRYDRFSQNSKIWWLRTI